MKNRIRELRAEKNITQLRLSLELEVSQETVSAYENGKHLPSLKSLIKMADIFHVSTDYLIGRSDVRKPSATSPLPNEDIALLDCFHDLDTAILRVCKGDAGSLIHLNRHGFYLCVELPIGIVCRDFSGV